MLERTKEYIQLTKEYGAGLVSDGVGLSNALVNILDELSDAELKDKEKTADAMHTFLRYKERIENPTNRYPEYIMQFVRQLRGLGKYDDSQDEDINNGMTPDEVFESVCAWNGFNGYAENFKMWVSDVYNVNLQTFSHAQEIADTTKGYDKQAKLGKMIYKESKGGKQIVFGAYAKDEEEGTYWAKMCPRCYKKYRSILGGRCDGGGGIWGTCSVEDCKEEADYCVDFNVDEVLFI